ncbi:MAG: MMPL family transporter, partial [Verrucomicrobiota bacterium]|nr:MMPL family transporter [Verrucomicrobiota bacterium]
NNPLYKDTIVSKNGKALCLYIPIKEKVYSYNVAHLVKQLTKDWKHDKVYITGLPVAEDTFGVQMLKQMAISAPLAGLMIFLMLWFFFRKMGLILAPLIIAIMSVICTMGLLIGLGFKVHIMSSMIAIFLMPIAVVDSVHILSEFFDVHHKFNDEKEAIRHVVGHLFIPMLYTSLTTAAGFASLATAPIPPVQVFGLHVAFGVVLAWVLTMTFVPAFILLFVSEKSLKKFNSTEKDSKKSTTMEHFLKATGDFTYLRWKLILVVTAIILGISIFGITKIHINDNPVKWFTKNHSVRVADRVLNKHFGGTYTAYLTLASVKSEKLTCQEKLHKFKQAVANKFEKSRPDTVRGFYEILENLSKKFGNVKTCSPDKCFVSLIEQSKVLDASYSQEWSNLADKINYMEIENLTYETLKKRSRKFKNIDEEKLAVLLKSLKNYPKKQGEPLLNKALDICDKFLKNSLVNFLYKANVKFAAPLFKKPKILHYVEKLEDFLSETGEVGKVSSVVDALKKANYELQYIKTKTNKENHLNYSIPPSPAAIGQVFIQLEGMKKKDFLFHFVTKDYQETNLWVQLKSGDNRDMQLVVQKLNDYIKENPPPSGIEAKWAGLTYLNVVWQEKMVAGTLASLGSSFIIVFLMMLLLFRSVIFGLLSMIPLSVTIAFIYGLIGLAGKDYDMPVAILSSLTLGLSVDFAIHFLERAREAYKQEQSWQKAVGIMFANPASAISRNAIVIAIGFTPLLLAPLVPYKTVGFFLATIMAVSAVGTLLILPALLTMLQKIAFKQKKED